MSVRDILKKQEVLLAGSDADDLDLQWVRDGSETTKALFDAAKYEYMRVAGLIKTGKASSPKSHWLVRAVIAGQAGFHRSILTSRRQFELCDWIERKNRELDELYSIHKLPVRSVNRKSRRDLEKEVSFLRKKEADRVESEQRAIVEAFFNSNMLDDRDVLRQENSRLRNDNNDLSDAIAQLRQRGREDEKRIAQLWEILEPDQRVKLGWRPTLQLK